MKDYRALKASAPGYELGESAGYGHQLLVSGGFGSDHHQYC